VEEKFELYNWEGGKKTGHRVNQGQELGTRDRSEWKRERGFDLRGSWEESSSDPPVKRFSSAEKKRVPTQLSKTVTKKGLEGAPMGGGFDPSEGQV